MNDNWAAIFDMDGVLVDTYHAHYQSWLNLASAEGLTISEEDFRSTFGRTSREVIAKIWGKDFGDEEIAVMDRRKEADFRRIIETDFPAMPGALALLQTLHDAGFRLAIGSSAPPENVEFVLDRMNLRALFQAVVTGKDVVRGKPDPQVFLIAAQRLGAAPSRCVVLEDAPVGLAAAHAAGMAAVGLASTGRTREALAQADLIVDSLTQLTPDVLRGIISRAKD